LESLNNARSFLSSAREVALNKPIIAISRHSTDFDLTSLSHAGKLTSDQLTLSLPLLAVASWKYKDWPILLNITQVLGKIPHFPGENA
jgi:acetyltransferase